MTMEPTPSTTLPDPDVIRGELDRALADALRRATTRAETIRLSRIQSLVLLLTGESAA
jgi:hypothetical protein